MLIKMGTIAVGAGLMGKAFLRCDRWNNIKVQVVSQLGFGMVCFGVGLLF